MTPLLECIIIDDEDKARENLNLLIAQYCPQLAIIGEAWDEASIKKILHHKRPDVLFLDIQIGTKTIFDILDKEIINQSKVIFITAYHDFALQGYSFKAVDYLLKPINPRKLVDIYQHLLATQNKSINIQSLAKEIKPFLQNPTVDSKIALTDSEGMHIVQVKDIMYCVGESTYTTFYLTQERKRIVSKTLKVFELKLSDFQFFRINKSTLINLSYILSFNKVDGGYVLMKDGYQVHVSRNKKKSLLEALANITIS